MIEVTQAQRAAVATEGREKVKALDADLERLFGSKERSFVALCRTPYELKEIINQIFAVGWKSCPLILVSGFAFGVVLTMQTSSSMEAFGAEAMVPQAVSFGLFRVIGPVVVVSKK